MKLKHIKKLHISSNFSLILALFSFNSSLLFAEPLQPETLIDIYNKAVIKHPVLLKAKSKRQIADEQLKQAKANAFLPKVDFTAEINRSSTNTQLQNNDFVVDGVVINTTGLGGLDQHASAGYTISLTQPIFHQDKLIANDQATLNIERGNLETEIFNQNLILKITKLYFNVLSARDSLKLTQVQKSNLELQLVQSKQRFEAGEIAIMNVNETKAGYSRAIASEIEAKQKLDQAKTTLEEVTGDSFSGMRELSETISLKLPEPNDEKLWINQAVSSNPNIIYQKITADIASKEINKKKSAHLPQFDLVASSSYLRPYGQDARFFPANRANHVIGIKMTLNLFEGGQNSSKAKEAFLELTSANATITERERAITRQTKDAFNGIAAGVKKIPALLETVNAQKASVDTLRLSLKAGRRTALDLVLAEEKLYQAQSDYTKARYDYLLDTVRLKHVTGMLTEDAIVEIDSLLKNDFEGL